MLLRWKVPSLHERKHVFCFIISRLSSNILYNKFSWALSSTVLPGIVLRFRLRKNLKIYLKYSCCQLILLNFKRTWFLITLASLPGNFQTMWARWETRKTSRFRIMYLDLMKYQHMAIKNENLCVEKYVGLLLLF